jgi:hypothetical protein
LVLFVISFAEKETKLSQLEQQENGSNRDEQVNDLRAQLEAISNKNKVNKNERLRFL